MKILWKIEYLHRLPESLNKILFMKRKKNSVEMPARYHFIKNSHLISMVMGQINNTCLLQWLPEKDTMQFWVFLHAPPHTKISKPNHEETYKSLQSKGPVSLKSIRTRKTQKDFHIKEDHRVMTASWNVQGCPGFGGGNLLGYWSNLK